MLLHNFAVWSSRNDGTALSNKETSHLILQSRRVDSPKKGQLYLVTFVLRHHFNKKQTNKKECTQTLHTRLLRNAVGGAVPAAGWALSGGNLRQEAMDWCWPFVQEWGPVARPGDGHLEVCRSWWLSWKTSDCEGTKAQGFSCSWSLYGGTSSSCYSIASPW